MKLKKLPVKLLNREASQVIKLVILITALSINSCSDQTADKVTTHQNEHQPRASSFVSKCRDIEHELGNTKVCGQPQKIVALGPSMLETILALEIQPVGYADYFALPHQNFDRPIQQIAYLGNIVTSQPINLGSSGEPSLEAIAKLKPDLILGDSIKNQDEYPLLSQIAPTLLFAYHETDQERQGNFQTIAKALGRSEQAEKIIKAHNQRLSKFREEFKPIATTYRRVLLLIADQLNQNLQLESSNSACGNLIEDLGFQLVSLPSLEQSGKQSTSISLEALPQLDADLIILEAWNSEMSESVENPVSHQQKNIKQQWNSNAITQSLEASKEDRVYFTTPYLCHALLGPIGTEIFLDQLRQQLLSSNVKSGES